MTHTLVPNEFAISDAATSARLACAALAWACIAALPVAAQSAPPGAPPPVSAPAPPDVAPVTPDVPRVSQDALLNLAAKSASARVILDVRTPAEFAAGHVPGAINIPHDQLPARVQELEAQRNSEVVVYCRTGRRSNTALHTLKAAGFGKLARLEGDFAAWEGAGRPIEKVVPVENAAPAPQSTPNDPAKP